MEKVSEHPLAQAIVEGAQARKLEIAEVKDFEAIPGHGVSAKVQSMEFSSVRAKRCKLRAPFKSWCWIRQARSRRASLS